YFAPLFFSFHTKHLSYLSKFYSEDFCDDIPASCQPFRLGWIICMEKPPDASTTTLSTRAYFGEIAPDTEPETYSLV
ncbi:hypothetical protein LINGRAPRIM_LOCUS3253, partial [Linum grandiflorum]